jgi:DNA-binding PadR family transcriptional regulator
MRRKDGNGLIPNERKVLAAALRLAFAGESRLHGYELFARLRAWENGMPMDHGTLYRCLRSLEKRGHFTSQPEIVGVRVRIVYELTPAGEAAARQAVLELAAAPQTPAWIGVGLAAGKLRPSPGT